MNLRDAVNAGYIPERTFMRQDSVATTGGHGDKTNGLSRTLSI